MNNQINNTVYVIVFENNWCVHENNKQMLTLKFKHFYAFYSRTFS